MLPNSQGPRKLKLNIDTTSKLHQWLTLKELQCGVRNHEATQTFVDNKKTLRMLADGLRNHDPNAKSRVELMSGGEVLGTALLTWLRDTEDEIELARRVVKAVWPWVCTKRSQTHPGWAASCEIKMDLVTEIESRIRTKVSDRYLAPAISRFVTSTLAEVGGGADRDQQAKDVWRELVHCINGGAKSAR